MKEHDVDRARQEFIDEFGLIAGESGLPPSVGRVLGLLVISNPSVLSAADIQKTLQLSTGSVSMATNILTRFGYVKRVAIPGQRRYYFEFNADSWQQALDTRLHSIKKGIGLASKGLAINAGDPRLLGMLDMYQQIYDAVKDMRIRTSAF